MASSSASSSQDTRQKHVTLTGNSIHPVTAITTSAHQFFKSLKYRYPSCSIRPGELFPNEIFCVSCLNIHVETMAATGQGKMGSPPDRRKITVLRLSIYTKMLVFLLVVYARSWVLQHVMIKGACEQLESCEWKVSPRTKPSITFRPVVMKSKS